MAAPMMALVALLGDGVSTLISHVTTRDISVAGARAPLIHDDMKL